MLLCRHLLELEQSIYKAEGVEWEFVDFDDNTSCVQLFEGGPQQCISILSLLDEECMFPKVALSSLLNLLSLPCLCPSSLLHYLAGPHDPLLG